MNSELKFLTELARIQESNNVPTMIEKFNSITDSLFQVTNSLFENKEKVKYHQRELEGKFFRFGLANQSIIKLSKGNQFNLLGKNVNIEDMFSLFSITRMQLESFLICYYLFFDTVSNEEKDLRYNVYKIHGLRKQSNFKVSDDYSEKEIHLNKIKNELNDSIEHLKNLDLFKKLSKKEQEKFIEPRFAKTVKSDTLFKLSGLSKSKLDQMWSIYSNHAHSEHISDRQYNTAYTITHSRKESIGLVISINSILTAKLIKNLEGDFDSVQSKISSFSEGKKFEIKHWSNL